MIHQLVGLVHSVIRICCESFKGNIRVEGITKVDVRYNVGY